MNRNGSKIGRVAVSFLLAACVGYVVAAIFVTTANLIRLAAVGADISLDDIGRTMIFDLWGMAPTRSWTSYGTLIFIGLAIAFPVAALIRSYAARARSAALRLVPFLYPAAGATAIAVVLYFFYQQYEVVGIPGSRGVLGLTAQLLAGALAGHLFQLMLSKSET